MNKIRQSLFANWHFMRIIRLILSVWILTIAISANDWLMGIFASFFLYTAVAGIGCCGPAGCYIPDNKTHLKDTKCIDYDEIK
jgi:hypothetical protein